MSTARTSKKTPVTHDCHRDDPGCGVKPVNPTDVAAYRATLGVLYKTAVEVGEPDSGYNCHGFSVVSSHGFFHRPEPFLDDDHDQFPLNQPRMDDVVAYYNGAALRHTGVVIGVSGNEITRVRSKWGSMGVVEHDLRDVHKVYGSPEKLFRRKAGLGPPVFLTKALGMTAVDVMGEEDKQALAEQAVAMFSDPGVYHEVMLASSPDVAKLLVESLPGVQELLDLGPEVSGRVAVDLLRKAEAEESEAMSRIALYILQRASREETVSELASAVRENKFSGINMHLAADALLSASNFEPLTGDPVTEARALAEKIK
jgi:hypothetical protein